MRKQKKETKKRHPMPEHKPAEYKHVFGFGNISTPPPPPQLAPATAGDIQSVNCPRCNHYIDPLDSTEIDPVTHEKQHGLAVCFENVKGDLAAKTAWQTAIVGRL